MTAKELYDKISSADFEMRLVKSPVWWKPVWECAQMLAERLLEYREDDEELPNTTLLMKEMLNGADDWQHYSFGGCYLCYNHHIWELFCPGVPYHGQIDGTTLLQYQGQALQYAAEEICVMVEEA